ncbi:MAG: molybdopterin-dependent oxidoreductase [Pseudomonadota bacterium]
MVEHVSYCRNCCAQCGVIITEEQGKITGVRGDRDNPLSKGYFCVKGLSNMDMHNGEDRLKQSLKRQADGSFKNIAKLDALAEISDKLRTIIDEHGPESVAVYSGTGVNSNSLSNSALKAWLEAIGTPYLYTSMTLDQPAKWVTACRMGVFLTGKYNSIDADVILLSGSNPAVSHASMSGPMVNPMGAIRTARKRGMKLIVIDPCKTKTARQADIHVKIKPGEDATFFAGMLNIIFANDWHDPAFCERFTTSLKQLQKAVEKFTPDLVAARTGVPVETLQEVAETFARAKRKSAHTGTGIDMCLNANVAEHLSECLNAVCGGYRRDGDLVRNMGVLFDAGLATETVLPPNRSWEFGAKCHSTDVGEIFGEYPTALLPKEITNPGKKSIRALIVVGGNLAKALSDPQVTLPALEALDLLVTLDQRSTETGRLSDYQIAISLPYERLDLNAILEFTRHLSFGQIAKPILPRPIETMEDWEFFLEVAKRLGKTMRFKRTAFSVSQDNTPGPTFDVSPDQDVTAEELIRWMISFGRFTYEELEANPSGLVPENSEEVIQPAPDDDGARLELCPDDVLEEIGALDEADEPDPDFPFRMLSRRLLETINSAYTQSSRARKLYPQNPVFMNEEDMEHLAISNEDYVLVTSKHGRVIGQARKDLGLDPGVIAISHGWGNPEVRDVNDLDSYTGRLVSIEDELSTINFMPRQSAIPVNVSSYELRP